MLRDDFPDGKEILTACLKESSKKLKSIEKYLTSVYLNNNYSQDLKNFIRQYVEITYYNKIYKNHQRMLRELGIYNDDKNVLDVASAKTIPIEELHQFEKARQTSHRIFAKCPFHDEKHPSFVIYKKTNSFHCFSCKSSGDSISFVMKLKDMDFVQAVKYLLAGRET